MVRHGAPAGRSAATRGPSASTTGQPTELTSAAASDANVASRVAAAHRREKAKEVAHAARNRKQEILPIDQYTSGESTDEEPVEPSAAPEPDAEITYSFDADKGPSQGSQILGQALLQAIERFEDRKTHELVSEEYEVLDENGEPASPRRRCGGKGKKALKSEDEDWEHV